ncbi:MAG TPA: L,D-transpeptidase [Vicinamibacterales bacterium]
MAAVRTAQVRRLRVLITTAFVAVAFIASPSAQTRAHKPAARRPAHRPTRQLPPPLECGDYIAFQVLLDRQGFSPGEIDGKPGVNFSHALSAAQAARQLPATGQPDCDTWHALGGETTGPPLASYTITEADAKGPFTEAIPPELDRQARLPALGYRSVTEAIAERFHAAPALLLQLNHAVTLAAGATIQVPAVQAFEVAHKPPADSEAGGLSIVVSRDDSALHVMREDGTIMFFAPVTTGSEHDPLPTGDWKVTRVQWWPVFHYNPTLFWDAKPADSRATLKAGPNNPVGVAWIGLTLEHYGLHGTPEPGRVGHAESHGCVRLTNWDVARVASLVTNGTPVVFR